LLPEAPPAQQLLNRRAVRDSWVDPDDMTPGASRTARQVSGYRAYCPLRRCRARHGERSSFSVEHVGAADKLRLLHDGSRLGFAGIKDWRPISATTYRPSLGPSNLALKQLRCRVAFDRAWGLFGDRARALVLLVVLQNRAVSGAAERLGIAPALAMQRLVEALDALVEHFDLGRERRRAA
jgi:hypothetical protein